MPTSLSHSSTGQVSKVRSIPDVNGASRKARHLSASGPSSRFADARLDERLVRPQLRQTGGVEIRVAEQLLADAHALHEQADVELVGHADAAVHLQAFL